MSNPPDLQREVDRLTQKVGELTYDVERLTGIIQGLLTEHECGQEQCVMTLLTSAKRALEEKQ